jgi:hypothetical protein
MSDELAAISVDPPGSRRLVALDCLRGLTLTIVLVDHVDDVITDRDFFTNWTLKGLGFSDAADAFVFLSGFTFGWVYCRRLDRDGFWSCQRRALIRAALIYGAMLLTALLLAALAWSLSRTPFAFRLPLTVTTSTMFRESLIETACLMAPIWGLSILAVYVTVLPFLPLMLAIARRSTVAAATITFGLYAGTQLIPAINRGDAGFNPLAWQVLIVCGLILGQRAARGRAAPFQGRPALAMAVLILLAGLAATRLASFLHPDHAFSTWIGQHVAHSPALSKTNLGVLRVLHFAALAIVTTHLWKRFPSVASVRALQPFVWCGRHSLPLFCLGVILSYLAAIASGFLPSSTLSLLFLALDAVAIQFVVAWLLESSRRRPHAATPGR